MADYKPPYPSKQIAFHQLLVAARATILHGALADALENADPDIVGRQISRLSPAAARKVLARAGIRDEHVFATPAVLEARPTTLGYYRLLLGVSKKAFYTTDTGLRPFQAMEEKDLLRDGLVGELPALCKALNLQMAEVIAQLSPTVDRLDVEQLPLLTLGAQFDGGWRNGIGKAATADVFLAIRDVVEDSIVAETETSLTVENAAGRRVRIVLASDPDVAITEQFVGGADQLNVAIEIKGGTDRSNAHNRAGEAEKSHQKVRGKARDFWTIIATKGVDKKQLATESPTTRRWYDVAEVLGRAGPDWTRFTNDLKGAIGI
jgi:hypothetical protein